MAPAIRNFKKSPKISDISTTHPCPGMLWVSKEAELEGGFKIFNLVRFFQSKWRKVKNVLKNSHFLCRFEVFLTFLNFEWKTVHQTKDFETPLQFRFFWHPWNPWVWMDSGWKEILSKVPVCMTTRRTKVFCWSIIDSNNYWK